MKFTRAKRVARNVRKTRKGRKVRRHRGGAGTVVVNAIVPSATEPIKVPTTLPAGITALTGAAAKVNMTVDPAFGKLSSLKVVAIKNGVESPSGNSLTFFAKSPSGPQITAPRFGAGAYTFASPVAVSSIEVANITNSSFAAGAIGAPVVGAAVETSPNLKITMTFTPI
jgi:hypothetical protein